MSGRPTIGVAALCAYVAVCAAGLADASASPTGLVVQYPREDARLPFVAKSFVFGAAPAGSRVWVNGRRALVTREGGWIAYVPFSVGTFVLHGTARAGSRIFTRDRTVLVAAPPHTTPATPAVIDITEAPLPREDLELQAGDLIHVAVKASTGARVTASIKGVVENVPLVEFRRTIAGSQAQSALGGAAYQGMIAGLYEGDVRVPPVTASVRAPVAYTVVARDGSRASAASAGLVAVDSGAVPRVGVVVPRRRDPDVGMQPYGIVETSSGGGWLFFPPPGTPFEITGRRGHFYRVALGASQSGWIIDTSLWLASAGAPIPHAETQNVAVADGPRSTTITVHLTARVPFRVDESAGGPALLLHLYGARTNTDFIAYGADRGTIRGIRLDQLPGEIAQMRIDLRQRALWGYRAAWRADDLELTIKKPPRFGSGRHRAVAGLLVVIDPGHSPDSGAIGPLGTEERYINLAIAKRLAAHLRKLGARTAYTRATNAGVPLYDRPRIAVALGADVLVSVHNNALPDGVDPFSHHGFSVYYYQPQSLALARAIHESYRRHTKLPDYGLYYDNLALARPTEEPAVLTESAFIAWPPEEELLRSRAFQDQLGQTIADGIERWAEAMRALESQPNM